MRLQRKSEEEKAEAAEAKAQAKAEAAREADARKAMIAAHVAELPKWEYQVKRIGEDKQKGLLGSQRMEQILNGEGGRGWELVMISAERATLKRLLPSGVQPAPRLEAEDAEPL